MKTIKLLGIMLAFLCSFAIVGCDDEPKQNLFSIAVQLGGEGEVAIGQHDCEITVNGFDQYITVDLLGDFDSFRVGNSIPSWLTVTTGERRIKIAVPDIAGTPSRSGKIDFTVFKGKAQNAGSITITQNPSTSEDLRNRENRAINKYISQFRVIDAVPDIKDIQTGSDAPYYKLDVDGKVYMQVLQKGNGSVPEYGDKIYFRFDRYNLIYFLENGYLGDPFGNISDISSSATSFILNDEDSQWGSAIQMPLLLGLPLGSEVNLVVASDLGFTNEIANITPFLYKVMYLRNEQIESSPVFLTFSQAEWMTFGVISIGTHRYFNKSQSLPANFTYKENFATGFGGILLVGGVGGEPYAYDASCPNEGDASVVVSIDRNSFEAVCPKCNSHFEVINGTGVSVSGHAYEKHYALKHYKSIKNSDGGYTITY